MTNELQSHEFATLIPDMTPEQYSALVEDIGANGLHYPIVLYENKILDGRNRYRACMELFENGHKVNPKFDEFKGTRRDAYAYVLSMNLHRRQLEYSQRAALAALWKEAIQQAGEVKPGRPEKDGEIAVISGEARQVAAEKFQVGSKAVDEAAKVMEKAPDLFDVMVQGGISLREAQRTLKEREREERIEQAREAIIEVPHDDRYRLIYSPIDALDLEPDSVDCIITDPPYPKEFLRLYEGLSLLASSVLKPGGCVFALSGQSYLPDVMAAIGKHLTYHWTLAYLTPGGQSPRLWNVKVNTQWKPILCYTKGKREGGWFGDVIKSEVNDNDKRFHEWGQGVEGFADLIERVTLPGHTILDPFVGGGTTGVAAIRLNRRFIGADSNKDAITITHARIQEAIHDEL